LSITRSPLAAGRGPGTLRFARLALAAALAALAIVGPAQANLAAVGPVDPATQVPAWFQDANGLQLGLCLDGPPYCLTNAAEFNAANGEGFYWQAGADLTIGAAGKAKLVLAQEATNPPGGRAAFMRARVVLTGAAPNTTYTVTHPFGTVTIDTDALGNGKDTVDSGCTLGPCASFAGALSGAIGPFLQWDPRVAPAPPAGHVGDSVTPHAVAGGTNGNSFTVAGPGGTTTDLFTVAGKLAGPPVPVYNGPDSLDFGSNANGTPTAPQTATVTSFGVPDASGVSNLIVSSATISGPAAADFKLVSSTCGSAMPSGTACALGVQFTPTAAGTRSASLDVATNAASGVNHVALSGVGVAPAATGVAAAGARSRFALRKLRTTHRMNRARVLRRGLRLTMRLPQGTEILKISILRVGKGGKVLRKPVWFAYRHPSKGGLYRLSLHSRKLRQRLKPGLYQVNITPGVSKRQLGRTTTTRVRITRR
jgi:hypothetical protein